jgi:hypothetical protein
LLAVLIMDWLIRILNVTLRSLERLKSARSSGTLWQSQVEDLGSLDTLTIPWPRSWSLKHRLQWSVVEEWICGQLISKYLIE